MRDQTVRRERLAALELQASQERRDVALRLRHIVDSQQRNWKLIAAGLAVRTILKSGMAARGLTIGLTSALASGLTSRFRGPLGGLVLLRLGVGLWRRFSRGAGAARR